MLLLIRQEAGRDRDHREGELIDLIGFDVPPLHTLYVDKPMSGHNLMQAIARVNRVFRDKPGGLIVDYLGITTELQKAVSAYTLAGSAKPT